jgi:hypothetical protein
MDRPTRALVAAALAGGCLVFWLVHEALVDDAYITLTYARTLGLHGEWGLVEGYQSNTATSPLGVLLLGALVAVVRQPLPALGILYVMSCVVTALGLRALGRELDLGMRVAVIGTPLLVGSPLLASTIGLETTLVVATVTFLAWAAARGDATRFGVLAGVLMWLRLDTVAIVVVMFLLTPALWRGWYRAVPLAGAVLLPWMLFSWSALGSAIPDTLVIKQGSGFRSFVGGFVGRYSDSYPQAVAAAVAVSVIGALAALTWPLWRRWSAGTGVVPALAVAAAAYYAEFGLLEVSPFFWYYGPPVALLSICAAIGLARLTCASSPALARSGLVLAAGTVLLSGPAWAANVSRGAPLEKMPVHGNWALPEEYRRIGLDVGELVGDRAIQSPGEVGSLIYHCRCKLGDRFSERAQLVDDIQARMEDSWLMRLNYHFFDPDEPEPMGSRIRLVWRKGPDPSRRKWDAHGLKGSRRERGHFALKRFDSSRVVG